MMNEIGANVVLEEKRDVLTRLDSLLARGQEDYSSEAESGPNSVNSSTSSNSSSGILKTNKHPHQPKKKSIRFPTEHIQEVIGYGGQENDDSSDDEEDLPRPKNSNNSAADEEMTLEEKNMLNLTRQNTTFNARNLKPNNEPILRLGVDKKVTPIITVRPFGMRNSAQNSAAISEAVPAQENKDVNSKARNQQNGLNSDGGSSETSSEDGEAVNFKAAASTKKMASASARLSFLNSTIAFEAKGEATTDVVSNWVKTPEDEDEADDEAKRPKVKLTRKSPYVMGPKAAILKGTPKPSISVRKPPIPQKPLKLLMASNSSTASSTASSLPGSPMPAPRRSTVGNSENSENSENSASEDGEAVGYAEMYSVEADVKNDLIIEVCKDDVPDAPKLPATNKVHQELASKNKLALEAIRKSLASKISAQEELEDKDDEAIEAFIKRPLKPLAPQPPKMPAASEVTIIEANPTSVKAEIVQEPEVKIIEPEVKIIEPEVKIVEPEVKIVEAKPQNSAFKSSPPSVVKKSVQFSPEAFTVTLPDTSEIQEISYNRWISRDLGHGSNSAAGVVESSFTGQPIAVQPLQPPRPLGIHKKANLNFGAQNSNNNSNADEIRKWTEKKRRSKSLPRGGSEIDEILGSSKTKPQSSSPLTTFLTSHNSSNVPVHRQSRVELYENDRKRLSKQNSRFSIKRLFKMGSSPHLAPEKTHSSSPVRRNSLTGHEQLTTLDKEHEREILERDKRQTTADLLLLPLELQSGGVELVRITPKSQNQPALYEKNAKKSVKSILTNKKLDIVDSGHETSSIHTDNSESETGSSSAASDTSSGQPVATNRGDIYGQLVLPTTKNKLYTVGRAKPVPPPRSHSLEKQKFESKKQQEAIDASPSSNPSPEEKSAKNEILMLGEDSEANESLPPSGYVVAGKMKIGSISVPAPNTLKKVLPIRSGSINSSSSSITQIETESLAESSVSSNNNRLSETLQEVEPGGSAMQKNSRLSSRNTRSVVHKNLEDNYGAVISANHEALAQILEQTSHNNCRPASSADVSKALKHRELCISDFALIDEAGCVETQAGKFFAATYGQNKVPVTLLVSSSNQLQMEQPNNSPFSLCPVGTFELPANSSSSSPLSCGSGIVSVFGRLQVETLETYTKKLAGSAKMTSQSWEKEVSFVLLQLTNGLKALQAQGIEEVTATLEHFLLIRADKDPHFRIIILDSVAHHENNATNAKMSLCSNALAAMLLLFHCENPVECALDQVAKLPELTPSVGMFRSMADILVHNCSSMGLGQVKAMLEYMMWGPSDIAFDASSLQETREQTLQRWLDLERATVLHNLIKTQGLWRIRLTVFEEYHLLFLVQTCAKMLHEASLLFESEVASM